MVKGDIPVEDEPGVELVQAAVSAIFLVFLARGHPLARQWSLFAGVCGFVASAALLILLLLADPRDVGDQAAVLGFQGGVGLVSSVLLIGALRTADARRFFDLYCDSCESFRVGAVDFLFNRIRCKLCRREWRLRGRRSDVDAFD